MTHSGFIFSEKTLSMQETVFFSTTALTSDIQTNAATFFKIVDLGQLGTKGLQAGIAVGGALALAYAVWEQLTGLALKVTNKN